MRKTTQPFALIALLALVLVGATACGATASLEPTVGDAGTSAESPLAAVLGDSDLSTYATLALGVLQLEDSDLAISAEQAETMLPYWQALQSLTASGTAADIELEAVAKQIQGELSAEQMAAVSDVDLSDEAIQAAVGAARGGAGRVPDAENAEAGAGGRNFGGGGDFAGGGGGPGGGGPGGDFAGGALPEGFDADALAERQANGGFQDQMLIASVVRLLQTKSGEAPAGGFAGGGLGTTSIVAGTLGISVEELRTEMQAGKTFAEIIEEQGGDMDAIRAPLADTLSDTPLAEGQDIDTLIDDLLNNGIQQPPAAE